MFSLVPLFLPSMESMTGKTTDLCYTVCLPSAYMGLHGTCVKTCKVLKMNYGWLREGPLDPPVSNLLPMDAVIQSLNS